MSAVDRWAGRALAWDARRGSLAVAWLSLAALVASYLDILYHVVDVVGKVDPFLGLVALAALLALLARPLSGRAALLVGTAILVGGLVAYVAMLPASNREALSAGRFVHELAVLLSGFSVLRMTDAATWALAVTPAPTFLALSYGLRRRWATAVGVAGLALGFFVLTGDSSTVGTMVGVLGATGAVGFGRLARFGGGRRQGQALGILLASMVVATAVVGAVPGFASPLAPPGTASAAGGIVDAGSQVGVGGSISLSPEVYFRVTAPRASYWRVAAYDRFTGSSWVRTDGPPDPSAADGPPGPTRRLPHRITAERTMTAYPAAATPVSVEGLDANVTEFGDLRADTPLRTNDSYTVVSRQPVRNPGLLRAAGTDYPATIRSRYLQVPASTTDRVRSLSARITANATTPYGKARAVEGWLEANKAYSLDVSPPRGSLVDSFLFEQRAGYCTYYATSMAVMLRTQGVPARFVTGYTPGQRVDDNTWVVRGLHSHAWVEVYFPDVGWVRFDPTPAGPRRQAEQRQVAAAGPSASVGPVTADDDLFGGAQDQPTRTTTTTTTQDSNATVGRNLGGGVVRGDATVTGTSGGSGLPRLPPPRVLVVWSVLALGAVAVVRRSGIDESLYRFVWVRTSPRGGPRQRVEGAFARVEYVLGRETRPRGREETIRSFVDRASDDERVREVAKLLERARYADDARPGDADRAARLAREVVADHGAGLRFGLATVFNRLLS